MSNSKRRSVLVADDEQMNVIALICRFWESLRMTGLLQSEQIDARIARTVDASRK